VRQAGEFTKRLVELYAATNETGYPLCAHWYNVDAGTHPVRFLLMS
jgi:hypothetical protein